MHQPALIGRAYGGVVVAMAVLFVAALAWRAWERREDRLYLFWCAAASMMILTPAKIPFGFDVRWLVAAVPLLVLITAPYAPPTFWRAGRWAAGATVSAIMLAGYLRSNYAGDGSSIPPDTHETISRAVEAAAKEGKPQ